ncbi:iron-enterobactin ABC transporter permease [Cellulomonas triticagri]|uniref:Iron-enterobactin ABC transporter permease n=1 Tax=Cellulomonas triticagri TaxID=2483352 RepID=A0A3M2JP62_9CELL|nr:iron-enterobactin ABC transporter permease [Cellulomonas triticagri]
MLVGSDRWHAGIGVREAVVCAVAVGAVLALAVVGLAIGDFPVPVRDVLGAFTGRTEGLARTVVLEWRLPRVAAAVLFGAALAVAGGVFQAVTRNPLASPDVVGLSNGAFTGMLVALVGFGGSWTARTGGALVGGLLTALVVALLARRDGSQGFRLIVVGIGVSATLAAFNTWVLLRADLETALLASAWGAGTLTTATAELVTPVACCVAVLLVLVGGRSAALAQLELGDDVAGTTGVDPRRDRAVLLLGAVALVSAVTAVAGPVAFVALAAPQIARRLVRSAGIPLAASAATGALVLLGSDLVAQHVVPLAVPVGVVTVVVGGAYLLWLLLRETRTPR